MSPTNSGHKFKEVINYGGRNNFDFSNLLTTIGYGIGDGLVGLGVQVP